MQNGAQHGLVGDEYGIDLPQSRVEQNELADEEKMARFSRSAEFQKLKAHLESRIVHYQRNLPDGRVVEQSDDVVHIGTMWLVSNIVVGEFKAVLASYEQARAVVEEEAKKNVQ